MLLNAGAALYIAGKAETLAAGVALAAELIDSGKALAVLEKLTMPMRLPPPIWPSSLPSVDSSMIRMNFFAPLFRLAIGLPAMLWERSRISTMSTGLPAILGSAVRERVTLNVSPQSI